MCHHFDLTREMDPVEADAANLRCAPFMRAPSLAALAAGGASADGGDGIRGGGGVGRRSDGKGRAEGAEEGEGNDDYLHRAYRECAEMVRRCGGSNDDGDGGNGNGGSSGGRGGGSSTRGENTIPGTTLYPEP